MAKINWLQPVSGNFNTGADWAGGVAPGSDDDAFLSGTKKYVVTASTSETVSEIHTSIKATLDITGGTFTATNGTATGGNAGAISVGDGATLAIETNSGDTITNTGVMSVSDGGVLALEATLANAITNTGLISVSDGGTLSVEGQFENAGSVILDGGSHATFLELGDGQISDNGKVTLSDSANNVITGVAPGSNGSYVEDTTISGSGLIGDYGANSLRLIMYSGVIDATGAVNPLILDSAGSTLGGLIEGTGSAGLIVEGAGLSGGGRIFAGSGSSVTVKASFVGAESVSTAAGGVIRLDDGASLIATKTIANAGIIALGSSGDATDLFLFKTVVLNGGGTISLSANTNNAIAEIPDTRKSTVLINVDNTVIGSGAINGLRFTLINEAGGVIDGDNAAAALTILAGKSSITNEGLIEATAGGAVMMESAVDNSGTLAVATGTLSVSGAVTGTGSASINGGTLEFGSSFTENVAFSGTAGALHLAQSQGYSGAIAGFSASGGTTLDLGDVGYVSPGEATFSGTATSGVLTVTDGSHTALINLKGDYQGVTFTASSDNDGGTIVVSSTTGGAHQFIAAAAALGGGAGGSVTMMHDTVRTHPAILARPGTMIA